MPPRYAYWTILIDDTPTAFRARERDELLPTFVQLQRKNTNVTMRWFAHGRLWVSREAERDDFLRQRQAAAEVRDPRAGRPEGTERRGSDWRPGGTHKDPRDRFKKRNRPERAWSEKDPATQRDRDKPGFVPWRGDRPSSGRPPGKTAVAPSVPPPPAHDSRERRRGSPKPSGGNSAGRRERQPWNAKPAGGASPQDRPWQTKPTGPRAQRKPWGGKPSSDASRGDRSWQGKKPDAAQSFRPAGGERKPWSGKSAGGPPRGGGWSGKPREDRKPWQNKPASGERKPFRARTGPPRSGPRKKRDDEPPDRG